MTPWFAARRLRGAKEKIRMGFVERCFSLRCNLDYPLNSVAKIFCAICHLPSTLRKHR